MEMVFYRTIPETGDPNAVYFKGHRSFRRCAFEDPVVCMRVWSAEKEIETAKKCPGPVIEKSEGAERLISLAHRCC
jgi:hypothetical protein